MPRWADCCVLISVNPSQAAPAEGVISMNHAEATRTLLKYLRDCGREETWRFFAPEPQFGRPLTRQDVFAAWSRRFPVAAETNVFWNRGSLKECYEAFFPHVCRFDSVICANDIAAAALLEQLKKDGVTVPKELYLLSYGDSSLARALRPAITSASLST
ncbi:MAG: substrate-binding domain-containing protein [Lachnospiraceae bacterium]